MACSFVLTEKAQSDLDGILFYIKEHLCNEKAAKDFFQTFCDILDRICRFPESAAILKNRFIDDYEIRKVPVKNYLIYYYVNSDKERVVVLSVRHSLENHEVQ